MRHAANETCGVPWQVIAAIAKVESELRPQHGDVLGGRDRLRPVPAVVAGPPSATAAIRTTTATPSRRSPATCAPTGRRTTCAARVWAYNHLDSYVDMVLAIAVRYGLGAAEPRVPEGSAALASVVMLARTQIGRPYVWGGASPSTSFDCSGLVQWAFGQLGARLPRTAQQQYDATRRVSRNDLKPGDLVFFERTYPSHERITHVGIYVGNGRMINAPTTGDVIREMDVFSGYWGAEIRRRRPGRERSRWLELRRFDPDVSLSLR